MKIGIVNEVMVKVAIFVWLDFAIIVGLYKVATALMQIVDNIIN